MLGFKSKLLGQILVAKHSLKALRYGGSITLTTEITAEELVIHGAPKTTVNRATEGFVYSVALELPSRIRINAVSPGLLEASAPDVGKDFPGIEPVSATRVAREYRKSVYGIQTGQIFRGYP